MLCFDELGLLAQIGLERVKCWLVENLSSDESAYGPFLEFLQMEVEVAGCHVVCVNAWRRK